MQVVSNLLCCWRIALVLTRLRSQHFSKKDYPLGLVFLSPFLAITFFQTSNLHPTQALKFPSVISLSLLGVSLMSLCRSKQNQNASFTSSVWVIEIYPLERFIQILISLLVMDFGSLSRLKAMNVRMTNTTPVKLHS